MTILPVGRPRASERQRNETWLACSHWIVATTPTAGFSCQSLGEELELNTNTKDCNQLPLEKKSLNWRKCYRKCFPFLGFLDRIFMNGGNVFSLLRPHLHEQIVLQSDTSASRYSTVSFGSHSQINTTWTCRHKQLISASSSSTHAVWRIVLLASSIFKDFHDRSKGHTVATGKAHKDP